MEEVIQIDGLNFKYSEKFILKELDLAVEKGDFVALIGNNGSGKSTLLKILVRELIPDRGKIKLFGTLIEHFDKWVKIGYIAQTVREFNKSFPATVREIIGANLYNKMGFIKLLRPEQEDKIEEVLEWVGMLKFKNTSIGSLSGGQQQRVLLARALITDPELILLDEPLTGLDARVQEEFYHLINRLNQDLGISIVMVSHDIHLVSNQANKIACLDGGRLFLHSADEFDFNSYFKSINGESKLIPEYRRRVVY
ncbi:MAG TPA: ABC transporter ATP-binding protein [Halanaerobiales bacterium]|nr:ABC transporter ATP-binding protein [Halanaerobiales bacterium]